MSPLPEVIRPWVNGLDVTRRPRDMWIIDFGIDMPLEEAQLYELPFEHVKKNVLPEREKNRRDSYRERWWIHVEPRRTMRRKLASLDRYLATVVVAKHRLFVWFEGNVLPDHRLYVFTRNDGFFFGVLQSKIHEIWSLATSSRTGVGNDVTYNNTTCFETFPFPWTPGHEDTYSPAYHAIAAAAKQLHEERHAWLNPPGLSGKALHERTLTNLYNALNVWRGVEKIRVVADAADFAPRLDDLHRTLDQAVCDAYGWPHEILQDDEEILRRLLALNLKRSDAF